MAQNITLLGASYSDVPAVTLPKTGGGTARFDDCTVVTAAASDVASGKIFVASDGTITTGTSSGGGGTGLVYETGTYTPTADIAKPKIMFLNTHTVEPIFTMIAEDSTTVQSQYSNAFSCFSNINRFLGHGIVGSSISRYAAVAYATYSSSGNTSVSATSATNTQGITQNYAASDGFIANVNSSSNYWRAGHTYKWIAVWAPTT